ncbi:MAG: hypothetical protein HY828_12875 [Actinobacteria bacterium]|nr:hypothetical protein [Actinomycetota bacterium]
MAPTRRAFLLGAGGLVLLAACGDESSPNNAGGGNGTLGGPDTTGAGGGATSDTLQVGFQVVQRFPSTPLFTPGEVRLPVSLSDGQNLLPAGPAELPGWIETIDGERVADITAIFRAAGIAVPYYEIRAELSTAGFHVLRFPDDDGNGATFEVVDASKVASPVTGTPLPPFDTPTVDDHRGVEPFCSLTPDPCPLHDITLTDALKSGKPVAYMVGTPAHCQTGTCAPGLEFLVAEHERLGDAVVMVHADVYADDAATTLAPAVNALGVDYEPIIYFCDATGTIVDRLDGVWDSAELRERLDLLTA